MIPKSVYELSTFMTSKPGCGGSSGGITVRMEMILS